MTMPNYYRDFDIQPYSQGGFIARNYLHGAWYILMADTVHELRHKIDSYYRNLRKL